MMYYDVYDVEPHVFCPRKPNVHDATRKEAGTDASVTFLLASRHRSSDDDDLSGPSHGSASGGGRVVLAQAYADPLTARQPSTLSHHRKPEYELAVEKYPWI
ncbi:hypothetical protein ABZX51_011384 [Aspergillus tubingensis]